MKPTTNSLNPKNSSSYTLGLNATYHDPAACLVEDGQVIAAAEEERFSRVKHGKRPIPFSTYELPFQAIDYCLREAGINLTDVHHIAYAYDPFLLLGRHRHDATITLPLEPSAHPTPAEWESAWDPLFLSSIVNAPRHLVGGFSFWPRLPRYHSGEEVLMQNLLLRRWGGCGLIPSGTYFAQVPTTVLNDAGTVDGHALDLLPEMIERYAPETSQVRNEEMS